MSRSPSTLLLRPAKFDLGEIDKGVNWSRQMSKPKTKFVLLEDCEPRSLIRLNYDGVTRWAIISPWSKHAANLRLVAILSGDGAPHVENVADDYGMVKLNFNKVVLSYGTDYIITADHAGPCDVREGQIFESKGSFILTETDTFLRLDFPGHKDGGAFLNLATGEVKSEPGGGRAAFKKWTLWHNSLESAPVALIESSF
jgi:hypothetical protein